MDLNDDQALHVGEYKHEMTSKLANEKSFIGTTTSQ